MPNTEGYSLIKNNVFKLNKWYNGVTKLYTVNTYAYRMFKS